MQPFHLRLAQLAFGAGDDLGLVLAGGYAFSAHQLTSRPSRDVNLATAAALPLAEITERLAEAYRHAGLVVTVGESTARMARMEVSDSVDVCEVDLLKEALGPPVRMSVGPVLSLDDAVGLKMRALHDRALHRDFIDVRAAHRAGYTLPDMERLCRRHTPHFDPHELADRLSVVVDRADNTFLAYGLEPADIADLRGWALRWEEDLRGRLAEAGGQSASTDPNWDAYLDD